MFRHKTRVFILFIMFSSLLRAEIRHVWSPIEPAEHVVLKSRYTGMFALFMDVISLCQHYENGFFKSGSVNFQNSGFYYDSRYGENWWEYYFEPIVLGEQNSRHVTQYCHLYCREIVEYYNAKSFNNYIIEKYIKIKPHIQEKIDTYLENNFDGHYILGVHYRGTDKSCEAPRVSYQEVQAQIQKIINECGYSDYKIFIASDELAFFNHMERSFPGMILTYEKSNKNRNNYEAGEAALIDCILLSKVNILFRTSSNLSLISTFYNPQLPVIELSQRHAPKTGDLHDPYTGRGLKSNQLYEMFKKIDSHCHSGDINTEEFRAKIGLR